MLTITAEFQPRYSNYGLRITMDYCHFCVMKREMVCLGIFMTLSCISMSTSDDAFSSKPNNTAVIAGQRMEMECRVKKKSKVSTWYFIPIANTSVSSMLVSITGSLAQLGDNMSSSFGVDLAENGSGTIYLNSTRMEDAGFYICEAEKDHVVTQFSAQLIVFESEPICETNLTENASISSNITIWMRCIVTFRGNWVPTVEWRQHGNRENGKTDVEGDPVTDGIDTLNLSNDIIHSTLSVISGPKIVNSFYSFKVFFTWPNRGIKTNASNIPDFVSTWKSWNSSIVSSETSTLITPLADTNSLAPEIFYLTMIVVVSVLFFILIPLIVVVCWSLARKKTAELLVNLVSTYENHESRHESSHNCSRGNIDTHAVDTTLEHNINPTLDGYTDADDLRQECSEAQNTEERTSKYPKYSEFGEENRENLSLDNTSASNSIPADPNKNNGTYGTIREEDIEHPRCYSLYSSGIHDSSQIEATDDI